MGDFEQDDLYPNDSSYFIPREPADQSVGRQKEKAKTLESKSILEDMVKRLEDKIAFYYSVESIDDDVKTKPDEFMHLYSAYKLVRDILISEKEYIEGLLDDHAPNR